MEWKLERRTRRGRRPIAAWLAASAVSSLPAIAAAQPLPLSNIHASLPGIAGETLGKAPQFANAKAATPDC